MPLTLLRHATQKPPTGPLKLDVGHPYAAGLELWYLGSERSGPNIQDFATLRPGRKGALAGGASWTPGKIGGGALKFASATDIVNIGTAHGLPSSATQAWTFSLWANWHDTTAASQTLIAAGYAGAPFSVELVNSGGLYLRYAYGGGTGTFLHREDTWPLDTWRHIFITDDGLGNTNSSSLWINGVPTAWETGTETGAHVTSYDSYGMSLGARQPFVDNNLNGQIDNVMVWSRALPPAAATAFYTEPFHLAQPRPVQRWFVIASGGASPQTATAGYAGDSGAAFNATAAPGAITASAGYAGDSGAAFNAAATPGIVTASAGYAGDSGTAFAPTASPGPITAPAGYAGDSGQAFDATASAGLQTAAAGYAGDTGAAFDATATPGAVTAPAGFTGNSGTAFDATAAPGAVSVAAGYAGNSGAAFDVGSTTFIAIAAGYAGDTGAAFAAAAVPGAVTAAAGYAGSYSSAFNASVAGATPTAVRPYLFLIGGRVVVGIPLGPVS
jgi:hypothetical protein